MRNTPITIDEQKSIRLEILKEVDSFCREHGVRYSLAFGTLLGAVRHQGFIPWDDDADIMMPLPDMLRLKNEFQSEKVSFCDIDTTSHYRNAFANMGYKATYRKTGMVATLFGVGVDVYPIIGIPDTKKERNIFFESVKKLQSYRKKYLLWNSRITKYLPFGAIPGFDKAIRQYRDYFYDSSVTYDEASSFYVVAAPIELRERTIYDCDIFNKLIELPFEGKPFKCIQKYDYFLRLMYGDYMQLPPIEERKPHHGQIYYWR